MAFAIVAGSVRVYPLEVETPFRLPAPHVLECQLTAAASDTALNLATLAAADTTSGPYIKTLLEKAEKILEYRFFESSQLVPGSVSYLESSATAGGGATETLTVTGLPADAIVLSIQRRTGGNAVSVVGYGAVSANSIASVVFSADPGAGAIARVAYLSATPGARYTNHVFSGTANAPVFTFAGGSSTPTALTLYMLVKLKPDYTPINNQGVST